ncbi:MAG: GvpL/GvpF family gas vesicle protein [Thermodesulfobacteriota bacterium]
MRCLLYCVFAIPLDRAIVIPLVTDGPRVHVVEKEGLGAVFSEISDVGASWDISEMMRYHGVIEWFFQQFAVVPFRFGTTLDQPADVERVLERRAEQYKKTLGGLEGCAEFGIRTLIDAYESSEEGCGSSPLPSLESHNPGRLYLSKISARYRTEASMNRAREAVTERYRAAFAGMFKECRSEISETSVDDNPRRSVVVSVYFLVPKSLAARFRRAFVAASSEDASKSVLTGPWPPYNFVLSGDPTTR